MGALPLHQGPGCPSGKLIQTCQERARSIGKGEMWHQGGAFPQLPTWTGSRLLPRASMSAPSKQMGSTLPNDAFPTSLVSPCALQIQGQLANAVRISAASHKRSFAFSETRVVHQPLASPSYLDLAHFPWIPSSPGMGLCLPRLPGLCELSLPLHSFDQFSWDLGGRGAPCQHSTMLCGTFPPVLECSWDPKLSMKDTRDPVSLHSENCQ